MAAEHPDAFAAELADAIDTALPQQQCRRCGYDACRPYAVAVAAGEAINRCSPGGDTVIARLASLTSRPIVPLDSACGVHAPLTRARIDEAWCIGCTLCIEACPVDAIVGAAKRMHTVLPALCTGCELCIPPCPVDCIEMIPAGRRWGFEDGRLARKRLDARAPEQRDRKGQSAAGATRPAPNADSARARREAAIADALARARVRRASLPAKSVKP